MKQARGSVVGEENAIVLVHEHRIGREFEQVAVAFLAFTQAGARSRCGR